MKRILLLFFIYLLIASSQSGAQNILIGKENIPTDDLPIRLHYSFTFNYNQFIYKQEWIHGKGTINKIAYYYEGTSTQAYDIVVYMGHTARNGFNGNDWIPVNELAKVYEGPFTLPGDTGWLEISLQTPFNYNNFDNLLIAIDKNSISPESNNPTGAFSNSIIGDDVVSMMTRDGLYNIDPEDPQGAIVLYKEIPNLRISGTLTESPYLYIYGSQSRAISTDPNTILNIDIETNLSDYNVNKDKDWLNLIKDMGAGTLTAQVATVNSSLIEDINSTRIILSGSDVDNDTLWINQYVFEKRDLGETAFTFGDFDNDQDLDLLGGVDMIGINSGNMNYSFQSLQITNGNTPGNTYWADYDNDSDLDFLATYLQYDDSRSTYIPAGTRIYRNDGNNIFTDIQAGLEKFFAIELFGGGTWSSVHWFDYNNDGKKDLLIMGRDSLNSANTILYKNLGNDKFINSGIDLRKCFRGNADFGDYNKDGLIDLVISGEDINGNLVNIIYKNEGDGTFTDISASLIGLRYGEASWGDFDNDGDLDLLVSGEMKWGSYCLKVYSNDGNDVFSEVFSYIYKGLQNSSVLIVKWNDYNNNGDLDIVGYSVINGVPSLIKYRNNGNGNFTNDYTTTIPGVISWDRARVFSGDSENDGDLDLIVTNIISKIKTRIYRNNSNVLNSSPSTPTALETFRKGTRIYLTWDAASDNETHSKSLSYNVRVGTAPGKGDIINPHADFATGFIKIPGMGNCFLDTLCILDNLPLGKYYWSVQTIDNIYKGSEFSPEQTFTVLPPFSEINPGIATLHYASAAWGDYDNDQDMDLIVTGRITLFDGETAKLYQNQGDSTFKEISLPFPGLYSGSVSWGDCDNDNDLDILISGQDETGAGYTKLYRNDGINIFTDITPAPFSAESAFSSCSDFNNDGKLDIVINSRHRNYFYSNEGNNFLKVQTMEVKSWGPFQFIDYDKDEDLDLLCTTENAQPMIYRNDGNDKFSEISFNSRSIFALSMDHGDYDKDGDMDMLLTGYDTLSNNITAIYRNDGIAGFKEINSSSIRSVSEGQARWGDFDNDSDLDIVLGGMSGTRIMKVYANKGNGSFEEIFDHPLFEGFNNEEMNYAIWGDYNNDGNLDFVKNGLIFSNNYNTPNVPPAAPDSLKVTIKSFDADFSWADHKNPVGVTYNLRIGTSPGGYEIASPMSDIKTGYRKIPLIGNVQNNTSWIIKKLKPAVTYYWSVQTIDAAFKGGPWAAEQSFVMGDIYPDFRADTVCYGLSTSFTDLSVSPLGEISSWKWDFGDGENSSFQNIKHIYKGPGEYTVALSVKKDSLTFSKTKKILVKPSPAAGFTFSSIAQNRTLITFSNTTDTGNLKITKWLWDFGDGFTYTGRNPQTHGYSANGLNKVTMVAVGDNGCIDTARADIAICNETLEKPGIIARGPSVWYLVCSNTTARYYRWYLNDKVITGANSNFYLANQKLGSYKVEISDKGECYIPSDEIKIPIDITGIAETNPFTGLKIYPNPTPGMFTIEMDNSVFGELIIDIYSQSGSKTLNIIFEKTTEHFMSQIDLSGQAKGIYIINLSIEEYIATRKIVVK